MSILSALHTLTIDQRRLLRYVESCAVDNSGLLQAARMSVEDLATLEQFCAAGLLSFGRVPPEHLFFDRSSVAYTHWVTLTEDGWALAHAARRHSSSVISNRRLGIDAAVKAQTKSTAPFQTQATSRVAVAAVEVSL